MSPARVGALVMVLLAGACGGGEDRDTVATSSTEPPPSTVGEQTSTTTGPPRLAAEASECPAGYEDPPGEGPHSGFASAGQQRAFHLLLPEAAEGPRPLFVALTGTVQEETAFLAQSRLDRLPADGWIVVAPVRNTNGLLWGPWDAMRTPEQAGLPNPDTTFMVELVTCLAAHYEIDASRVFVGGISIGGTMTNYVLRRHSDLFAGGIVGSGNFMLTEPADPEPLDDMTVVVAWGGDGDRWMGCPDGRMGPETLGQPGCVDVSFVADASAASQFYASQPNVRQVACSAPVGHIWIADATEYMARILYDHPKGSDGDVALPPDPPADLTCSTEAFAP